MQRAESASTAGRPILHTLTKRPNFNTAKKLLKHVCQSFKKQTDRQHLPGGMEIPFLKFKWQTSPCACNEKEGIDKKYLRVRITNLPGGAFSNQIRGVFFRLNISGFAARSADFHPMTLRARPLGFYSYLQVALSVSSEVGSAGNLLLVHDDVSSGRVPVLIFRLPQHILSHTQYTSVGSSPTMVSIAQ